MKPWKLKLNLISGEIFKYSLITYLLLILTETLQEGFVSYFFNLNILLVVVLINGVIMVLTHHEILESETKPKKITSGDVQNILIFAVLGGGLVYLKTEILGKISILIALFAGIIIILLSILLFADEDKTPHHPGEE